MIFALVNIFEYHKYIPHGNCYLWENSLVWLHLLSDVLISLAYFSIPLMLIYFLRQRTDIPFHNIFQLFSAFIVFCGLTHAMGVLTLWYPFYWLSGIIKALTALISVFTAFELFPIIPLALSLPSPEKLTLLNQELQREIKEKEAVESKLKILNQELEDRISQRTLEIQNINERLEYKIKLEQLTSNISNLFLKISTEEIHDKFTLAVSTIAQCFKVDQCCLYLFGSVKKEFNNCNSRRQLLDDSFLEITNNLLAKKKYLKIENIEHYNENQEFKNSDYIKNESIKSLICLPISYDKKILGLMVLAETSMVRSWETVEINFLLLIREIIIKAINAYNMQKQLKNWNKELKRSNQDLEQFAYVASHDLQEPLRIISSFSELLLEEYQDKIEGEGAQYLGFIISASQRMKELIKDLLTFSRVQTSKEKFELVNINEVVKETLEILQISIEEAKVDITYSEFPSVFGSKFQLIQLWQNLLSNAIKFRSHRPVKIDLTVKCLSEDWLFCVADNGIGISSEFQEKIFVVFKRLHNRDKYEGTGIGLAICKKIVVHHGGKIWVESEENQGAKFYFTIPKTAQ